MHNKNNPNPLDEVPELHSQHIRLAIGENTLTDFFLIYDPHYIEESLLDLFNFAVGNPEMQTGVDTMSALQLVRNITALVHAIDPGTDYGPPIGDA